MKVLTRAVRTICGRKNPSSRTRSAAAGFSDLSLLPTMLRGRTKGFEPVRSVRFRVSVKSFRLRHQPAPLKVRIRWSQPMMRCSPFGPVTGAWIFQRRLSAVEAGHVARKVNDGGACGELGLSDGCSNRWFAWGQKGAVDRYLFCCFVKGGKEKYAG